MYTAKKIEEIDHGKGSWNTTKIGIFDENDKQVGSYERNYPRHGVETFAPFKHGDKWYALYSKHYTATSVMSLPDCKDIGGEDPNSFGFCPVEIIILDKDFSRDIENPEHAFIAGCVWGDDTSWKIEHLDISKASEGIITRTRCLGYVEMGRGIKLKDAVQVYDIDPGTEDDLDDPQTFVISIACERQFDLVSKKFRD